MRLDARSLGHSLALENPINSYASVVAKRDRLCPSIAFFEEDMFEVCCYKRILNGIAVIVKRLHHVFSPLLTQFQRLDEEDLVVLNQALCHFRVQTLKLQSDCLKPEFFLYMLAIVLDC